MARRGQGRPQNGARRGAPAGQRRSRRREDILTVLDRAVSDVRNALRSGPATSSTRRTFQAVGLVLREERDRTRERDGDRRSARVERLDEIATSLAKTAVRDATLLALLGEDAVVSDEARALARTMLERAGIAADILIEEQFLKASEVTNFLRQC